MTFLVNVIYMHSWGVLCLKGPYTGSYVVQRFTLCETDLLELRY